METKDSSAELGSSRVQLTVALSNICTYIQVQVSNLFTIGAAWLNSCGRALVNYKSNYSKIELRNEQISAVNAKSCKFSNLLSRLQKHQLHITTKMKEKENERTNIWRWKIVLPRPVVDKIGADEIVHACKATACKRCPNHQSAIA